MALNPTKCQAIVVGKNMKRRENTGSIPPMVFCDSITPWSFDNGDLCYFDLNAELLNKLDPLLNNCIRFMFNLRKYGYVSVLRSQLQWLLILLRRNQRALISLFSFLRYSISLTYFLIPICISFPLITSDNLLLLCSVPKTLHFLCKRCYYGVRSHLKSGCLLTVIQYIHLK